MPTNKPSQTMSDAERYQTLSRPDQLHAVADATRWRILGRLLLEPASVQQLARALGVAKGTVGHHVRVLEAAGLIRVVEKRRVRGVVEKRYARVARQFRLEGERTAGAAPDPRLSHLPLRQALAEARTDVDDDDDASSSVVVRARMPAERARRFARMVEALAEEFAEGAPQTGETFGFVAAVYVPDWSRPPGEED